MTLASFVVLIGSNIDPRRNVSSALDAIGSKFCIDAQSPTWRTPPIGADGSPHFLNLAVRISARPPATLEDANATIRILKGIEAEFGRVRTEDPNAPRTIDLDLVLALDGAGRVLVDSPIDRDITRFHHAAVPVAAVVDDATHIDGRSIREWAERLGPLPPGFSEHV